MGFKIKGGQPYGMAKQVKVLAARHNDFSAVPWVHLLEREN